MTTVEMLAELTAQIRIDVFYTIENGVIVNNYFIKINGDTPPKGAFKNRKTAEAVIALAQLEWLRDEYIKRYYTQEPNWKPDWKNTKTKWVIFSREDELLVDERISKSHFLTFPEPTLCEKFFKEQKELIERAKPLL